MKKADFGKAGKTARPDSEATPLSGAKIVPILENIIERAFFQALMMIDIANHKRGEIPRGEPKVGGHPSACASSQHILGALHLVLREPEDYFACKPHVSPIDHAYNFILQTFRTADGRVMNVQAAQESLKNLRKLSKNNEPVFQSYHAESDPDSYRYFPSGSVGIPPVNALYTALGYDYLKQHGIQLNENPMFWCLMGDSEFREGSLAEAMPDGGDRELSRVVWIVDYNRQNLDGTRISNEKAFHGSDAERIANIGTANGWDSIVLKHGSFRKQLFEKPGGAELKKVLDDETSDFEMQSLLSMSDAKFFRKWFKEKSAKLEPFLKKLSDSEITRIVFDLAGHDVAILLETFEKVRTKKGGAPTLIVPYTIKGFRLECQARSGNHSSLPETHELLAMAKRVGLEMDSPFEDFPSGSPEWEFLELRRKYLNSGIEKIMQTVNERRRSFVAQTKTTEWPIDFNITALKFNPMAHTQWMWGQIAAKLDRLARGDGKPSNASDDSAIDSIWTKVSQYFVTMAPDVGSSTNTSPNMNGKIFGDVEQVDFESLFGVKDTKAPDVMPKHSQRTGHIRFEIAEGNCMSAAGSLGKFSWFTGIPLYPAMTIYDFFVKRAHDQFYYNLYWRSSFATIGTPSGVTLAPEGAQHSWKSDFQIPHCITWEPAFAKELEWILADTLRRHFAFDQAGREAALIRCVTKGLNQNAFLENLKLQPAFQGASESEIWEVVRKDVLEGGYCLIDRSKISDYAPGDNVVHIFAMGALVAEAIEASKQLLEKGICGNVFVVTSPDLLLGNFADLNEYAHLKNRLGINANLHLKGDNGHIQNAAQWLSLKGSRIPIVSVHDGEPGLLDNIGSIVGAPHKCLAVRKTSKSGTTADVFHYHHIDASGIVEACLAILSQMTREEIVINSAIMNELSAGD